MALAALILTILAQDKVIEVVPRVVDKGPMVDGSAADDAWKDAPETVLSLWKPHDEADRRQLRLRAIRTSDEIFFLLVWTDETRDARHMPFVWNKESKSYDEADLTEDVASLGFELEGEFDSNMLAGKESRWDVWHWKAWRTNPAGFAMDKTHQYSRSNLGGKSHKLIATDGRPVWIARPEDQGTSATKRADKPAEYAGDEVPQFAAQAPSGSAADVRAKGEWKDKAWTLELGRKLRTGHKDDTQFETGRSYGFSVAVFDREEDADHSVAATLKLTIK
jgi:ethylbenzene dehydrogenase